MTSTNIDYVDTYFEFPTLIKIHGEPTYFKLIKPKNQLKSNVTSVTTYLGGWGHSHLGLVIAPAEYTTVSANVYNILAHPGAFSNHTWYSSTWSHPSYNWTQRAYTPLSWNRRRRKCTNQINSCCCWTQIPQKFEKCQQQRNWYSTSWCLDPFIHQIRWCSCRHTHGHQREG